MEGLARKEGSQPRFTEESTSRFVDAGGVRVHVHDAGSGPVLLCIHGGAPGAYGWGNFGANVPGLAEHFRVLVVDLPGYGRSDVPDIRGGRYGFHAQVFADLLAALGIESAHVLGMATGGAVAMMLAIEHPGLVDDLVLVSSAGGLPLFTPMPSEGQKLIQSYYGGEGPSPARMRAYLEMMMYDTTSITDELVEERYAASIRPELTAAAPEGRPEPSSPKTEQVWRELDRIKARTLVVWGRDNRVQGYDNALFLLNRIPDVQVHLYGRTGLWVPFERVREFNTLLVGFLGGASAR
ncbi:alpha/beta fold hydrolase [Knoellia sp. CPCC 206435]|uniref:alpha/beta fold hydrolase n=1 Tax=Knoellia terrae TaxID=3404797 RepID=UPI003B42AEB8